LNPGGTGGSRIASLTIRSSALVAAAACGLAAYMGWLFYSLPDARGDRRVPPPTSTRVFGLRRHLIGGFAEERRIFVPYDQIPPVLIRAFLAAEDRTFFKHGGIDFVGFSRAMLNNVGQLRARADGSRAVPPSPSRSPRTSC
jgi:penicillin-binding protein 1A